MLRLLLRDGRGRDRDSLKVRHLNGDVVGQSEEGGEKELFSVASNCLSWDREGMYLLSLSDVQAPKHSHTVPHDKPQQQNCRPIKGYKPGCRKLVLNSCLMMLRVFYTL